MKTSDPRIRVENYGRENWRTVARDDCGDWAVTGPPYPTRAEALVNVPNVVRDYFGEGDQVATVAGKWPTHVVVDTLDGYVFRNDSSGELFGESAARAFASERNAERKPERRTYRVFALTPA